MNSPSIQILHAGSELRLLKGAAFKARSFTQDGTAYDEVVSDNEYRLPKKFSPDDVIIDVGAHIGFFSLACLGRGAKHIEAYEPDYDNFELLKENVGRRGVKIHHKAVWRSDRKEDLKVRQIGTSGCWTAMSVVLSESGRPIESVSLDSILDKHKKVRLLKLDCEGSEYAIMLTVNLGLLGRCQEICGEIHTAISRKLILPFERSAGLIIKRLNEAGFETEQKFPVYGSKIVHHFWAKRKD